MKLDNLLISMGLSVILALIASNNSLADNSPFSISVGNAGEYFNLGNPHITDVGEYKSPLYQLEIVVEAKGHFSGILYGICYDSEGVVVTEPFTEGAYKIWGTVPGSFVGTKFWNTGERGRVTFMILEHIANKCVNLQLNFHQGS